MLFPQVIAEHAETLVRLPFGDLADRRLRDLMVDAAFAGQALDRQGLATISQGAGAQVVPDRTARGGDMAFSFTRGDCDPDRAARDLGDAIDALAAQGEIAAALAAATERLKEGEEAAFAEQSRLHAAARDINERLANLAASD
jgi:DNA primase